MNSHQSLIRVGLILINWSLGLTLAACSSESTLRLEGTDRILIPQPANSLFVVGPVPTQLPKSLTGTQAATVDWVPDQPIIPADRVLSIALRSRSKVIDLSVVQAGQNHHYVVEATEPHEPLIRQLVPLDQTGPITLLRFHTEDANPVWIAELGLGTPPTTYRISDQLVERPVNIELHFEPGAIRFALPAGYRQFRLFPDTTSRDALELRLGEARGGYQLRGEPGDQGFAWLLPQARIAQISLKGVAGPLRWWAHPAPAFPEPLILGLRGILDQRPADFRRPDVELYRWTLFPHVFFLAFRDLDIQDDYLRRLAFFVEKRGFRGQLLTDRQLEGKHGWNAHDYDAMGLARFFQAAQDQKFSLNKAEIELRQWCQDWGVILRDQDKYRPGVGGIISTSFDAGQSVFAREYLAGHEAMHGAFYELPKLRDQAKVRWEALDATTRAVFNGFFEYSGYDTGDPYLMVNEYQAYLLQQSAKDLPDFVHERLMVHFKSTTHRTQSQLRQVELAATDQFLADRETFAAILRQATGLEPPQLYEIQKIRD